MRTVVAGALGEDAHVAGVSAFLRLAEEAGWRTVYLGAAVPVRRFVAAIRQHQPELVAVSYRLTPETGAALLQQFMTAARAVPGRRRYVFGGTPPLAARAAELDFFERCFGGDEPPDEVLAYLRGQLWEGTSEADFPDTFVKRLAWKRPLPLFRHHFGRPTVEETVKGVEELAESRVLDVISLGIDQDAQENFFDAERQDPRARGAGGVPVRTPEEYRALWQASRRGNYPLMRVYSGTNDQLRLAEMYLETIHNAWCATSIFWFNQLDRRGPLGLEESIRVHQDLMRWHGRRAIPVELNEPHHWGMREAPDVVYVVASFLSAYNARAMGVRDYIAQYMFNSPGELADRMDLAKVLACIELAETLASPRFRVYRQTRTGLLSYPVDPDAARGHVAASVYLQMAVRPDIVHVVGATEARHATTATELVESVKIARRAVDNALRGAPDMTADPVVRQRTRELVKEARVTLAAITGLASAGVKDPWTDPATLARAVGVGVLDAPHLKGHPLAKGEIVTRIVDGACRAVDPRTGAPLPESRRLASLRLSPARHVRHRRRPRPRR